MPEDPFSALQEITLQYNLCNEPWLKYTMTAVSDRGLKPSQWTSARLHSETLFLETHQRRYELSRVDTGVSSGSDATFVSACCRPCQSILLADLPPGVGCGSCSMPDIRL